MSKNLADSFFKKPYFAEVVTGSLTFLILLTRSFSPTGFILAFSFAFLIILSSPFFFPRSLYNDLFPNFWPIASLAIPTLFTALAIQNQNVSDFGFSIGASLISTSLLIVGIFAVVKFIYRDFDPGWKRILLHGGWLLLPNFALIYQVNFINPIEIKVVELAVLRTHTTTRGARYIELLEKDGLTTLRINYPKGLSNISPNAPVKVVTRKGIFGLKMLNVL